MTEDISITTQGKLAIITLTRPQVINALNDVMIMRMADALKTWRNDPSITTVLLQGEGPKGFCSGGDVKGIRQLILEDNRDLAMGFIAQEYDLNALISTYPKPIVSFQHGIVMGAGMGISCHARYRFCTPDARFAMPEGAIGFHADCAVNAILARSTRPRALAFLLSGSSVTAADAIALGLSDALVPQDEFPRLRDALVECANAPDPDRALANIAMRHSIDPAPSQFIAMADALSNAFEQETLPEIIDSLHEAAETGDLGASALTEAMRRHSPTSLVTIFLSHLNARKLRNIHEIVKQEKAVADFLLRQPDLVEGIRSVLVDKDFAPKWSPAATKDVNSATIQDILHQATA